MALTKEQRDALPEDDFAVPGKRALPFHDRTHVKMAWDSIGFTKNLTPEERAQGRRRILRKAEDLGIDTATWHVQAVTFEAMAIEFPAGTDGHPNKLPFSGVMTRVDQQSDKPVGGALGHHVFIPKAVAEEALPSLLGMAIDYCEDFDGHDKTQKIGIITEATIEGDAVRIAGFFYAADFPELIARIQAEKESLGFSYEAQSRIRSLEADPWHVEYCVFTGAALLYKDKAAYTSTSLAAQAEQEKQDMDIKELAEAVKALTTTVTDMANSQKLQAAALEDIKTKQIEAGATLERVKPHAEKLRSCAAAMEAAGIGTHATEGHVNALRHMAASMEAEATMGKVPHIYNDHSYLGRVMEAKAEEKKAAEDPKLKEISDAVASLATVVKDLKASATANAAPPERKTISPEVQQLLAKAGITQDEKGKLTLAQVDKALETAGITGTKAIEAKFKIQAAGLIDATAR